ncbi:MAG: pseudaminic acid cytidylyltransferase [Chthoniobacterales bacterium]
MSSAIAIITARGGSKRIPKKNIRAFHGRPIISYPIKAALAAKCFQEVIVSTDSEEIAEIARAQGAKVPFLRSEEASNDKATSAMVMREIIARDQAENRSFDFYCMIYPTAVFLTPEKLTKGYDLLSSRAGYDTAFTVVRHGHPIQRAFHIKDEMITPMWPENAFVHSQNLEPTYHDAAQFYWLKAKPFMESGRIFAERSAPIVLLESEAQDIDNEEDWKIAELKFELWRKAQQQ